MIKVTFTDTVAKFCPSNKLQNKFIATFDIEGHLLSICLLGSHTQGYEYKYNACWWCALSCDPPSFRRNKGVPPLQYTAFNKFFYMELPKIYNPLLYPYIQNKNIKIVLDLLKQLRYIESYSPID